MDATGASDRRRTFIELQEGLLAHYRVEATSKFAKLAEPDMQVHIIEAGSGAPLLALHGGDGEAVDWAPLLAALQPEVHIYAVDRPGFGLSDAFDYQHVDMRKHAASFVASILDTLGLESVTLAGGSMGGYFALVAALSDPERIDRLVLVGMPAGLLTELPEGLVRIGKSKDAAEDFVESIDSIEGLKNQYRNMFSVDIAQVPELYFETRLAGLRLPGAKQAWAALLQRLVAPDGALSPEFYLGDELSQISQPTLVIWGERDMLGSEVGEASTQRLPEGRFSVIRGIGHFPFLEAPRQCATAILDFISSDRVPSG